MSTSIDQRVVQMRFDNKDFEKNANSTISVLEKLKQKLTFKDSSKALDELQSKTNSLNFNTLEQSANNVGNVLETKLIAKLTIVHNLVNRVADAGVNMVKSLSVDQLASGWNKYEQKLASTQTIMNATGQSADDVAKHLNKLMWYTDETSYSFNDMVNNVGLFTSAGVSINDAIPAIMGIANASGLAGASIQDASHAMMGFSKAMGQGYMSSNTWEWLKTAHIATAETKKQMIEAAEAMGTLKKVGDGLWKTLEGTEVTIGDFTSGLKDKWLTSDVILSSLHNFGDYSEAVYELYQNGMSTADAMDAMSGKMQEVGEKGMRASQESKTFSDALNAVKDAVSSGWMKTYELIFGAYEEAKDLWSSVNEELYDIFAAGGEARNELLEKWKTIGGRDVLLKGLMESWEKMKALMDIVHKAFEELFPPITVTNLLNLTNGFYRFIKSLTLSQEAAYSLKVILKTLLLPLKLITLGVQVAATGLKVFVIALNKVVNTLLTMMASSEYTLKVFQNLFGEAQGTRIFNALSTIFANAGNAISQFVEKLKNLKDTLSSNEGFMSFIDGARTAISDFVKNGLELLTTGLESIASGDWKPFFKMITDGFKNLPGHIGKAVSAIQEFVSTFIQLSGFKLPEFSFKELLESVKEIVEKLNPFKEGIEDTSEKGKTLKETVENITKAIMEFVSKINPAKILVFGFGVALIGLIVSISKLVTAAANVTDGFKNIGASAKGVLDGVKGVLGSLQKRLDPTIKQTKTFGDTCLKVAASVVILVAALMALSKIPADDLERIAIAMMKLGGAIAGAVAIVTVANGAGAKLGASGNSLDSLAKILLSFAIAMGTFAMAIKIMDGVEINPTAIGALAGLLTVLTFAVAGLAKQKGSFEKGALTIVALAASLLIITQAINSLDMDKAAGGLVVMIGLMGMMTLLLLSVKGASAHAGKAASSALKIAIALGLMSIVIKMVGEMALNHSEVMMAGFIVATTEMFTLLIPLFLISTFLGKYMKESAKALKNIAIGLSLLIIPIYILGTMDPNIVDRGIEVVKGLLTLFGVLSIVNNIFSGLTKSNGSSFSKGMVSMAAAITLLIIPIAILGSMDLADLAKGAAVVTGLIIVLSKFSILGKQSEEVKKSLIPLIATIGIFTAAIALLTLLPLHEVLAVTAAVTLAVLGLGKAMTMMSSLDFKSAGSSLLVIGGIVGGMVLIIGMLEQIENTDGILVKVGAMSAIIFAIAGAAAIISGSEGIDWKHALATLGVIEAFVITAGVVVIAVGNLGGNDMARVLLNAVALSGVLLAVAGAAKIMSGTEGVKFGDPKQTISNIGGMLAFLVTAGLVVGALGKFGSNSMEQVLSNAVALSLVLLATAGAAAVLTDSSSNKWDKELEKKAGAMVAFIVVAGIAVGLLGRFGGTDPAAVIANAVALGIVVNLMAVAVKIMGKTDFEFGYAQALVMSVMVLAVAGALLMLRDVPTEGLLDKTLAIIGILAALTAMTVVLGKVKIDIGSVLQGMAGIGIVLGLILGVLTVVGGIAEWLDKNGEVEGAIARAGSILEAIGKALGGFVGGIVAGFSDASTKNLEEVGDRISTFIDKIGTSIDTITKFDDSLLTKFNNFSTAIDTMRDVSNRVGAITGDNLVSFGTKLNDFAPQFATFCDTIKGYGTDDVNAAVSAADTMASIAERLTPGLFENTPSLGTFGQELEDIAPHIANFAKTISEAKINAKTVEASVNAASTIAGFADQLSENTVYASMSEYSTGGILSSFATELEAFGPAFRDYAQEMSGVDNWDAVTNSSKAAETIAAFANKLPGKEGIMQTIMGEKEGLKAFAEELDAFAPSFVSYAIKMGEVTDWSVVTNSSKAAETVATFANKLPSMGGWFQDWFGEKNLQTFGTQLSSFGYSFKIYSDKVGELDIEAIRNSADAANYVIDLYSKMPTTGGWLEAITGGTMDLSTFGTGMKDLGEALETYNSHVENLNYGRITASTTAAGLIVDLSDKLGDFKKNNVVNFKTAMNDFADLGIDTFLKNFTDAGTKFVEAGQTVIGKLITGLQSRKNEITTAGADAVNDCLTGILAETRKGNAVNAGKALGEAIASGVRDEAKFTGVGTTIIDYISKGIENRRNTASEKLKSIISGLLTAVNEINKNTGAWSNTYLEFGIKMMEGLMQGWKSKTKPLDDAMGKIIKSISDKFKKSEKDFQNIGVNVIKGIAKGMEKEKTNLNNTAGNVATGIVAKMMQALGIHSPAKEAEPVGYYTVQGVAKGIENDHSAEDAAEDKSHKIIKAFSTGFTTDTPNYLNPIAEMADMIANDDTLDKAAADKGSLFGRIFSNSVLGKVGSVLEGAFSVNPFELISTKMPTFSASNGLNWLTNTITSDKTWQANTRIETLISGGYEALDTFRDQMSDLHQLDSFRFETQVETERRIEVLTKNLENQNEVVRQAELDYLAAVEEYGQVSAETSQALGKWQYEQNQATEYQIQLAANRITLDAPKRMRELTDNIRSENDLIEKEQKRLERAKAKIKDAADLSKFRETHTGTNWSPEAIKLYNETMDAAVEAQAVVEECNANIMEAEGRRANYEKELVDMQGRLGNTVNVQAVKNASKFLELVSDSVADLRTVENDEAKALLEFVDALQNDVANGIITNPAVLDAITEKFSEVLGLFDDMVSEIDRKFDTESKEYQLWELTVGADATEEEKNAKKLEIMEKEIASAANKVKVAAKKEQEAAMMYGAGSVEAQEAHNELLDAQIAQAKLIDEYYETQFDMEQDAQKAIEEAEKTNQKGKTALEKAQAEFEEWRKDGSLEEWYAFGATDEELMDALLKKYKDDEDKTKEAEKTYQRSGKAISDMMNATFAAADYDVDAAYAIGQEALINAWAKDWESNADSAYDAGYSAGTSYASGYANGVSGVSGTMSSLADAQKKTVQYGDQSLGKVNAYVRDRETGDEMWTKVNFDEYKALVNGGFDVLRLVLANGEELIDGKDEGTLSWWFNNKPKIDAMYDAIMGAEYYNEKGTWEKLNDPVYMSKVRKHEQWLESDQYKKMLQEEEEYAEYLAKMKEQGYDLSGTPLHKYQEQELYPYLGYLKATGYTNYDIDRNPTQTQVILMNPVTGLWENVSMTEAMDKINQGWEYLEHGMETINFQNSSNKLETKYSWKTYNPNKSDYDVDFSSVNAWFEEQGFSLDDSMGSIAQAQAERFQSMTQESTSQAISSGITNGYLSGLTTGVSNVNAINSGSVMDQVLSQYNSDGVGQAIAEVLLPNIDQNSLAAGLDNMVTTWGTNMENAAQTGMNYLNNLGTYLQETDLSELNASDAYQATTGNELPGFLGFLSGSESRVQNAANIMEAGENVVDVFSEGIQNEGAVAMPIAVMSLYDGINTKTEVFYTVGNILGTSVIDGMLNAVNTRTPLVSNAFASLSNLVAGMSSKPSSILGAITSTNLLKSMSKQWEDVANSDDYTMKITPVVDLDQAKKSFKDLQAITSSKAATEVSVAVEERTKKASPVTSGSSDSSGGSVINYTQNNYSPKALSRYDIYRDTQNQLSRMKGATSNK